MDAPLRLRLRLAGRSASIRRCLAFIVQNSFTLGLTAPLWQYMLKEHRHMPDSFVVWLTAIGAIGHLAGLRLWAWMADVHGFRPVVTLSTAGAATLGLVWLAIPGGGWGVMVWAVAFYLLWGFVEGGLLMGRTTAMLAAVPSVYQTEGLTLAMLAFAVGDGAGGLAGGAILDQLARWFPHPSWPDPKVVYLAAAQVLLLLILIPARRLAGRDRQTPTPQIAALLWRRLTGKEEPD
jgi:MFS family permease